MFHPLLSFGEEIKKALRSHQPIVVLESTIFSHEIPYPDNLATAQSVEQIIRDTGAVPATIALHQGKIHIGINEEILPHLANRDVMKAARRDLAFVLSRKLTASTTAAAAMYCAYLANFPVFVTGGIDGVHQRVEESFDISADLIELASTPITVVCSGVKSILDLPKTLEMLETHGVPVIGYRTNEFPAFYSHSSGIPVLHRIENVEEIAHLMACQRQLQLHNGIIVVNPIPKEAETPDEQILPAINQAQKEANPIQNKTITPSLLHRIAELTAGQSLQTNIELIKINALLGAKIALAYKNKQHLNL
jgi:pseudouridine-5'-phosphate glycosidase